LQRRASITATMLPMEDGSSLCEEFSHHHEGQKVTLRVLDPCRGIARPICGFANSRGARTTNPHPSRENGVMTNATSRLDEMPPPIRQHAVAMATPVS